MNMRVGFLSAYNNMLLMFYLRVPTYCGKFATKPETEKVGL